MFNVSKIQDEFEGLVGIRLSINPDYSNKLTAFVSSDSGLYLDDVEHFKSELFIDSQDYAGATDGNINVKMNQIERSSIANVVQQVFTSPAYIDRNLLYTKTYDTNKTIDQVENIFYGYRIDISNEKNVAFMIKRVILEMIGEGEITLSLYHSSRVTPIFTEVIEFNSGVNDLTKEVVLDWAVDMSSTPYKGSYFLVYQKPITALKPLARDYENADVMNKLTYLDIERIYFSGNLRDLEGLESDDNHNGINVDITVYEDFTDLIIQNKFLFARALQLNWAMTVMLGYINSLRSNRNERIAKDFVNITLLAVEGQRGLGMQRVTGLREQFAGQILDLQKEFKKIREGYFGDDYGLMNDTIC